MSLRFSLAVVASFASLAFLPGATLAASPSQQECEAAGGTFDRTNGTATCVVSDPVGNSEASGGKSQTRDKEDSAKGNITPKDPATCTSGPGNQSSC